MNKRKLTLREYQYAPFYASKLKKRLVLALAPGSGKTEIAIAVIEDYLKTNPNHRVLVLAHSTNVLKDNFYERIQDLDVDFSFSSEPSDNSQVHICIPHAELQLGKYNFVIIDEAHENYLADRVQRILKTSKCSKELLLTGTPSKFIKEGTYEIYTLAANEINDDFFAKLSIELIASEYLWKDNYNKDLEIKADFEFTEEDTRKTLENVLIELLKRVSTNVHAETFNRRTLLNKAKIWLNTYKKLGKSLIVCKSIEQSEVVYEILKDKQVDVKLSNSKCDPDNEIVGEFKKCENGVLVVVNRARLGYNDEKLMNLIDLSGSKNPDIIYQMMCRVLRGNPEQQKYYLKVTPKDDINRAITSTSVNAALMLTDREYLSTYNGDNFNDLVIPVIRSEYTKTTKGTKNRKPNKTNIFPQFTNDVINTFKMILEDCSKNTNSIYKLTTIGDVRRAFGERVYKNLDILDIIKSCAGDMLNENDYIEVEKDLKEKNLIQ